MAQIHYSEREYVYRLLHPGYEYNGSRSEEAIIDNVQISSVVSNIRIPRPLQSESTDVLWTLVRRELLTNMLTLPLIVAA